MSNENEKILIERCQKGDIEAFEELIKSYEKKVFNIAYRIIGDYSEAEDVSQEIFIKIFRSINKFKGHSSFYTWLFRIAVNECIDRGKKRKKITVLSIDAPIENDGEGIQRDVRDTGNTPEDECERKELRREIEGALNKISYEHRTMIVLRDIQGFSYEEISELVNCPPGTVKSRINRARKALKELLSQYTEHFLEKKV